ncbi:Trehalose/maltose transport system permease protein MalF [Metallosphaera sp. J1]|uniref:ABC transporter permease n=1 Tax=Metallosphaera javensis (ex Hofmann et al. 2022) TaxID=99938 RepID=UPI001EDE599A|nr:ABC transporter permease subunit [Metallosphaera javensis (ex Hofmann et al. 2022)]MCG3109048.1 Trehalose/maltose transport system permease protein MalF [Metallosphaera javensis (ex Hofmann et al. 2022)]
MKYVYPYLVYITAFGIVPFLGAFALLGVNFKSAFSIFELVPLGQIVVNTLIFAFFTALLSAVVGTILAILVDMTSRGSRMISLLTMLPYTIPFTSSALIWTISLYGKFGWFSYIFHVPFDPLYLSSTAIWAVTGVSIWSSIPVSFLVIVSSLRSIPREVREASVMDGLSLSQFYGKVAVPMIGKAFWISFLLQFVLAMGNFDLPYVLTQGGPGYASTTLPLLVFDEIFLSGNFSGGEVVAAILGLMATLPSIALIFLFRSKRRKFLPSVNIRIPDSMFRSVIYVISAVILFLLDFPVYWMILVAFRNASLDFRAPPVLLPVKLTPSYFISSLEGAVPYLITSAVVGILASVFTVLISLPASYEASRRGLSWMLFLSIYLYSLPAASFIIPLYLLFTATRLLNTWWALILSTPIFTATFATWIFYNFYLDFPKAYDDAASVFGIKRKLTRIVFPLSRGTLFTVFLLSFVFNWHLLFYPLIFASTPYNMKFPPEGALTITVYALDAIGDQSLNWGLLASSALVAALPVMIVTLFAIDRVLRGDQRSGVKFI